MSTATTQSATGLAALAGKYLTVILADEAYGLGVLKVREIIRLQKITPVPQLPDFVKGVINLRGRVIPIIDLRAKFGLKAEFTERTCIVVVQVKLASDSIMQMGLIVDAVEEVAHLSAAEIEPTPEFGTTVSTDYILAMATVKGRVKTIIDVDHVVGAKALSAIASATS